MRQNVIIPATNASANLNITNVTNIAMDMISNMTDRVNEVVSNVAELYSQLLGEEVTVRQTWHMLHAQVAFLGIILPVGLPIVFNAASVAWFALALKGCKKSFQA